MAVYNGNGYAEPDVLDRRPEVYDIGPAPGYSIQPPPEDGAPSNGGATAPVAPADPWARFGDILAGFGNVPAITPPSPSPTVGYINGGGGGVSPLAWLLIAAAAGGAYWWYTKRKGG